MRLARKTDEGDPVRAQLLLRGGDLLTDLLLFRVVADGKPEEVLRDLSRLSTSHLVTTSLLKTNLEYLPKTGRFLRAEALAHVNH